MTNKQKKILHIGVQVKILFENKNSFKYKYTWFAYKYKWFNNSLLRILTKREFTNSALNTDNFWHIIFSKSNNNCDNFIFSSKKAFWEY